MRPITPPPDSGMQPRPHYCTVGGAPGGGRTGCPDWPGCLFPGWLDDEPEPDDDDEVPGIAVTLAAVLGYFVGAIVLVGSATLLCLEVF